MPLKSSNRLVTPLVSPRFISSICSPPVQIGYSGGSNSILASGVYGIVKVVTAILFVSFGIETLGRRYALFSSSIIMGTTLFIIGALLKVYPPDPTASEIQPASKAMTGLLYIYAVGYSIGWGPVPWIYVSDIFPTRTRHYGLSIGSGTEWLFSTCILNPHL